MDRLLYLYIASGVFGLGVILVDFFTNAISSFQTDGGDADGDDGGDDGDEGEESAPRMRELTDLAEGPDSDGDSPRDKGSYITDYHRPRTSRVLKFIGYLRTLIYFCAGFGIIGSFALLTGESRLSSLLWSIPVGGITVLIFKLFKRIQNKQLDSSFSDRDFLDQGGENLLPLRPKEMGKVRIHFGKLQIERYARLAEGAAPLQKGDPIRVVRVDQEVVYVQKDELQLPTQN